MKQLLTLITIIIPLFKVYSQITIVDSTNQKALSFTEIKWNNGGMYSSKKGIFYVQDLPSDISYIKVKYLGFIPKKISRSELQKIDTIFLHQKSYELPPITISSKKPVTQYLKPKPKNQSYPLLTHSEFIAILKPNREMENSRLVKLKIPFQKSDIILKKKNSPLNGKKMRKFKRMVKKDNYYVRINIYSIKDNKPDYVIYRSSPIGIKPLGKDKITLDLSSKNIFFKKNGIAIGIENIGLQKQKDNPLYRITIRPYMTTKQNEYYKSKSLLKFYFPRVIYRNPPVYKKGKKKIHLYLRTKIWVEK